MVKWLDIELQLATLQVLMDAELKRGKNVDEIDVTAIHEEHRDANRKYYRDVAANDGFVTPKQIADIFSINESELEKTIEYLESNRLILASEKGLIITTKGNKFLFDELNKNRD